MGWIESISDFSFCILVPACKMFLIGVRLPICRDCTENLRSLFQLFLILQLFLLGAGLRPRRGLTDGLRSLSQHPIILQPIPDLKRGT